MINIFTKYLSRRDQISSKIESKMGEEALSRLSNAYLMTRIKISSLTGPGNVSIVTFIFENQYSQSLQ